MDPFDVIIIFVLSVRCIRAALLGSQNQIQELERKKIKSNRVLVDLKFEEVLKSPHPSFLGFYFMPSNDSCFGFFACAQ